MSQVCCQQYFGVAWNYLHHHYRKPLLCECGLYSILMLLQVYFGNLTKNIL